MITNAQLHVLLELLGPDQFARSQGIRLEGSRSTLGRKAKKKRKRQQHASAKSRRKNR